MTTLRRRARSPIDPPREAWTDAHLILLAHLIGDGCHLKRHVLQYTTTDPANVEAVRAAAWEAFGVAARVQRERNWYQVYLSSDRSRSGGRNPIAAWLDELGLFDKRSWEKFVPARCSGSAGASIALFLRHLWATDGSLTLPRSGQPRIYYSSQQSAAAIDVQSLLLRLGIVARVARDPATRWPRPAPGRLSGRDGQLAFLGLSAATAPAGRRSRACGPCSSLGGPTPTST